METDNRYRSAGEMRTVSVMSVGDGAECLAIGARGAAGRSCCAMVCQSWRKIQECGIVCGWVGSGREALIRCSCVCALCVWRERDQSGYGERRLATADASPRCRWVSTLSGDCERHRRRHRRQTRRCGAATRRPRGGSRRQRGGSLAAFPTLGRTLNAGAS